MQMKSIVAFENGKRIAGIIGETIGEPPNIIPRLECN